MSTTILLAQDSSCIVIDRDGVHVPRFAYKVLPSGEPVYVIDPGYPPITPIESRLLA